MSDTKRVLVVDNERDLCRLLTKALGDQGYTAVAAHNAQQALRLFAETVFPVVILDIVLGARDALPVLKTFRAQRPDTKVIVLTAQASLESAIEALRLGAFDYVRKGPQSVEEIPRRVSKAFADFEGEPHTVVLRQTSEGHAGMIGTSAAMQTLYRLIERVAPTDANVLIRGETGTGKELVAKAIHAGSPRHARPFESIDGNIPESLAESMLFGVIPNYPGLHRQESLVGIFEQASGGTLFLDEIGDLPLPVQPKLLRAIQEKAIRPLGASRTMPVDVRVLAATNRDLEQAMEAGQFRVDLYHRLNVVTLETVALRQRRDDIPILVEHFLARACEKHKRPRLQLSDDAFEVLRVYDYPGNVRELENLIDRAVILTAGETIFPEMLPVRPRHHRGADFMAELADITLADALGRLEKTYLEQQMRRTRGNISQAASRAGIDRKNFREKLKKYNIALSPYITP